jgi:dihydrofolate reductase
MTVSLILASTSDGGIGYMGSLPWPHISEDMRWFRKHTQNQIVVMGRTTWDDPKMPKPLPNRVNCVVTHRELICPGVRQITGDFSVEIKSLQHEFPEKSIFFIGGKTIVEQSLSFVSTIYLTIVHGSYLTDVNVDLNALLFNFECISKNNGEICSFYHLWRR